MTARGFGRWDGQDILSTVALDPYGEDRFCSIAAQSNSFRKLFGGQFMGLTVHAAILTAGDRPVHAVSGFFLQPGALDIPLELAVERSFDGGTFSARRVTALQAGTALFVLEASFQAVEEGVVHTDTALDEPAPDTLKSIQELLPDFVERVSPSLGRRLRVPSCIDLRPIDPENYIAGQLDGSRRAAWVRTPGAAGAPDSIHRSILAYLTDYMLAGTAVLPHEAADRSSNFYMASLNQAMWFHRQFQVDRWLRCECRSPVAHGGRGLGQVDIFQDGRIVATAAQEVLIRVLKE